MFNKQQFLLQNILAVDDYTYKPLYIKKKSYITLFTSMSHFLILKSSPSPFY